MTELSGGVVSLLNKRRRACLGVERQIVGDAVAYRNRLLKWNTNCLAEAYKLSYKLIVGSLPLAKNAKHSPSKLSYIVGSLPLAKNAKHSPSYLLSVPVYKLQYFICDTRGPHAESWKEYDVNFTYTSTIQRQLSVYPNFTDSCTRRVPRLAKAVEKGAPALLQRARGIGHRSMLLSRPQC